MVLDCWKSVDNKRRSIHFKSSSSASLLEAEVGIKQGDVGPTCPFLRSVLAMHLSKD